MPFPTIDPSVDEYYNPITEATYRRGPNNVWTQIDQFNKVDIDVLKDALDAVYVNLAGDEMTGPLVMNHAGDSTNLFELLGRKPGSADDVVNDRVFWMHHNAGTVGDAVNYAGRIENDENLVNKKWVEDAITTAGSLAGFLKKDGDTMSGTITFDGENSRIAAGTTTNLTGRCTLLLTTAGSLPVGISTSSQTAQILSLYRYDNTKDDNRDEIATFQANGYTRLGGKLRIRPGLLADTDVTFEIEKASDEPTLQVRKSGRLELKPSDPSGDVFGIYPAGLAADNTKAAFKVWADGTVQAGPSAGEAFMASANNDIVTKGYLDSAALPYLPLTGGTLTGQIIGTGIQLSNYLQMKGDSSAEMRFYKSDGSTRNARYYSINNGDIHRLLVENNSSYVIRCDGSGGSGSAQNLIECTSAGVTKIKKLVAPSAADDAATKKYVDDNSGAGPAVKLHNTSTPPSGESRGQLLMTSDNKFYIYV